MCPDFFTGCCSEGHHACTKHWSWHMAVLCSHPEPSLWVWECSTDHCWKAVTHHQYIVCNMCSNPSICPSSFLQAYNATPFKWLKFFNRSTYSLERHGCTLEWILQTLFTSGSTTVIACRVKTQGAKRGLLSTIWSPMIMTNESLILQPLSKHILYPGVNEYSPWGCSIFFFWQCMYYDQSQISEA